MNVGHQIVETELMGSLTMQVRYMCACGWFGPWWNGHADEVGAATLPTPPASPPRSKRDLHVALYGSRHRCAKCRV